MLNEEWLQSAALSVLFVCVQSETFDTCKTFFFLFFDNMFHDKLAVKKSVAAH